MKAAFIDRDGVINEERGYVHTPEQFVFLAGAVDALRDLQAAGYLLIVITNQSGIARGLYAEEDYMRVTTHMLEQLLVAGVRVADVRHCPHLPDAPVERYRLDCSCRKPRPGMLLDAMSSLHIDPSASILIGDRGSDVQAGRAAGVSRCYLVTSGRALSEADVASADAIYEHIGGCVRCVIASDAARSHRWRDRRRAPRRHQHRQ